jgi:hypothetical protein
LFNHTTQPTTTTTHLLWISPKIVGKIGIKCV